MPVRGRSVGQVDARESRQADTTAKIGVLGIHEIAGIESAQPVIQLCADNHERPAHLRQRRLGLVVPRAPEIIGENSGARKRRRQEKLLERNRPQVQLARRPIPLRLPRLRLQESPADNARLGMPLQIRAAALQAPRPQRQGRCSDISVKREFSPARPSSPRLFPRPYPRFSPVVDHLHLRKSLPNRLPRCRPANRCPPRPPKTRDAGAASTMEARHASRSARVL